ncbi:MAG TPA: hypothetical protein VJJ02_03560 [Candidatus Paceibacterota bacterium]
MKNFLKVLCLAVTLLPAVASHAADETNAVNGVVTASPEVNVGGKVAMERLASAIVVESYSLLRKNEVDNAVGYATTALKISQSLGDADMSLRITKLLDAYLAIGMMATISIAAGFAETEAAIPGVLTLACKMLSETAPELEWLVEAAKKPCTPI